MEPSPINMGAMERLRFIDFIVDHFGAIQRRHVVDYFGVSQPQASLDIGRYKDLAPSNIEYDLGAKMYRKTAGFVRAFP